MVYYPLQLLQRVGVREVLLVTGQQHAGDFIDLLGDGRVRARGGDELLFDLDLTYKVQVEPGGIAQVVGMARDFARRRAARRVPRRQHLRARAGGRDRRRGTTARSSSRRRCPTRRTSASSPTTATAGSPTSSRRRAIVDKRYEAPPSNDAVVGLYCYPPDVFEIIDGARAVEPRRARDHRRQPRVRRRGELEVRRVEGWWHDGGKHWADLADVGRLIEETGANK